jgi:hypothetical protein
MRCRKRVLVLSTEVIGDFGRFVNSLPFYQNVWLPAWDVFAGTFNALFPYLPPLYTTTGG